MKCLYVLIISLLVSTFTFAQSANYLPAVQQKIQALKWVTGKWQGTVSIMGPDGSKQEYQQTVEFRPKLKNSILQFTEAANRGQDTVFQNIGMLGYDALKSKYTIQAYTNGGMQIQADVEVQDKKMIWRLPLPNTLIRYTITLNEKGQWHQIGEGSADDGQTWNLFFESKLSPVKNQK
ncbi:DUF1579 family protein [Adhaeribacter radiodurans]|uniref:DUF1579 family protein n=1 Tax=Adhaeribacter radiodurans TaxID=2745197 RepID=A0A7L7L1M4_9BACT|nr:DUF1579 family protein [Adhaeribacter radiodurans]QMU26688.1 DUF1579 family protein [Adhaeribacter radiodurans]